MSKIGENIYVCVCACVRACVCVHAYACVCVCARVCKHACIISSSLHISKKYSLLLGYITL